METGALICNLREGEWLIHVCMGHGHTLLGAAKNGGNSVELSLEAVRAYFDCRNQLWLGGSSSLLRAHLSEQRDPALDTSLCTPVLRKRKMGVAQRNPLLRAHTKIRVTELTDASVQPSVGRATAQITAERDDFGRGAGGRRAERQYLIQERVLWVIQDGFQVRVEGRLISHRQRWVQESSGWKLAAAWESDETHLAPSGRAEEAERHRTSSSPERLQQASPGVQYDRLRALRYSELWWDGYNPAFPRFREDCTNFVSQCLLAGGIPMARRGSRAEGWWIEPGTSMAAEKWSYSWTTTQALRSYVRGIGAIPVRRIETLRIGDLIFYDWEGRSRFHHAAIVADFDETGAPLVNAHTDASYHRPYLYSDSRAWTPQTQYEFVHLPDAIVIN